jgi:tetratricopeptide (TPR) repeat protein/TolB-like protein
MYFRSEKNLASYYNLTCISLFPNFILKKITQMAIWSAEIKELEKLYGSFGGRFPELEKELQSLNNTDDENVVLLYSRRCLEVIVTDLCECELKKPRGTEPLKGIIDKLLREEKVPSHIIASMHGLNTLSTFGTHPKDFDPEQVKPVLSNLTIILKWYLRYKGIKIPDKEEPEPGKLTKKQNVIQAEIPVKPKKKLVMFLTGLTLMIIAVVVLDLFKVIDIRTGGAAVTNLEKSVALMPFKNLTGDSSNDYLTDMHHEASYQELAKISQVKPLRIVGSLTTSAIEKDRMSLFRIAREARVDYLIEGSVLGSGDLEEIMIRVIQIFPEEKPVLTNNYSINRTNIHIVHKTIAEQIARKIGLDLLTQDQLKLSQPHQVNPQSLEAYTRGMSEIEKSTKEGNIKGLEYLQEAVRIAPEDAFANAGLALGYLSIAHSPLDPGDALVKGEEYAFKSIMLDSSIAEVHAALAITYLYKSWKFAESEKHFKRALELNPNLDMAHYHYAWGLYLWGRMDEAIAEHKLAQKYDPFNPLHTAWLGGLYYYDGKNEEAIQEALKSLEIQKDYPIGYIVLGKAYLAMGRYEEAIKTHQKLAELYPDQIYNLCLTYIATGNRKEAEKILAEIEKKEVTPIDAYNRAKIYAVLGRKDEAFKWLNYEPHHGFLAWAAVNPDFKSLHGDPRWDEFLKKLNLPKK